MARIRTIKPEFWEDEKLSTLPLQARLLFIGTWNFADDFGVITSSAKFLKSKIFPYDESLRENEIIKWLDALVNARMLVPFFFETKGYYKIRTFDSHQLIDKRYTKSVLPEGISANELLAGLEMQQNTTCSHSEHNVFTRSNSNSNSKGIVSVKGKVNSESENFNFDFLDFSFKNYFLEFLDYRKKIKKPFKTQMSIEACYKNLIQFSKNNPETANEIIQQSIANQWQGLFELKEKNFAKKENLNGTARQNTENRRQSVANLESLADAVLRAASNT